MTISAALLIVSLLTILAAAFTNSKHAASVFLTVSLVTFVLALFAI